MIVVNIIPTYNERENVGRMIEELQTLAKKNKRYDFYHLIADDKSPDGTANIVKKYQRQDKKVILLEGQRVGLGEALIRAYQYAVKNLKADVIIPNDCDFSFEPKHIPQMLQKIKAGYDVVVASRHVGEGGSQGWTFFRRLNHFIANDIFAWHIAGIKEVHDHNGNFKAIRVKNILDKIDLPDLKVKGFGFQMWILYELSKHTSKFLEIPVIFTFRKVGESKVSFNRRYLKTYLRDVAEYIKLCLLIRRNKLLRSPSNYHDQKMVSKG
jgi:dolichol-phosphate mannosyltransferase